MREQQVPGIEKSAAASAARRPDKHPGTERLGAADAVDAADALLHAVGRERQVEMEEAVGELEVAALLAGLVADEDEAARRGVSKPPEGLPHLLGGASAVVGLH